MPEQSFGTGQGAGRFVLSDRNPNPLEGCACSPGARNEDSGPPFVVFTASVPQTRNEHNFVVCAGCIGQAACKIQNGAELLGLGGGALADTAPPAGEQFLTSSPTDPQPIAPHVNPTGESFEEVERELDARADDEPVI